MKGALRFKHTNVPRQQGEQARLKVIQGPDAGAIYVLTATRALVGRGEDADVMISDLKASRIHAEMGLTPSGWVVRDKGSANGILYNGKAAREGRLKTGDTITLGETTLEFTGSTEAPTMMLVAPPKSLAEVQSQQRQLSDQKQKVRDLGSIFGGFGGFQNPGGPTPPGPGQTPLKKLFADPKILLGVGLGLAFLLLDTGEAPKPKPKKPNAGLAERDLASYLPQSDASLTPAIKTFFNEGFREFTKKNWARARSQFESVLQIAPGHPAATRYLEQCNKEIDEDVAYYLQRGKKGISAGRLRQAKGDFEAVLRLLDRDRTNPNYIESRDQLDRVTRAIRDDTGVPDVDLPPPGQGQDQGAKPTGGG